MPLSSLATHSVAALVGVFIGVSGTYFADRFAEQRRAQDNRRERRAQFTEVETQMPDLIKAMREDVLADPTGMKREFFPYEEGQIYMPDDDRFFYAPSRYPRLTAHLALLESCGYIKNVSETDARRYRMSKEFVALLNGRL